MPLPHKFVCMKRVDGIDNNKSAKEVYERESKQSKEPLFLASWARNALERNYTAEA